MNDVPAVTWIAPLAAFLTLFGVVVAALFAGYRRDRNRHETLRVLIEKGAPLPPEMLSVPKGSDLRRGVVLLAAGLGLTIFLLAFPVRPGLWAAGVVPGLIGIGYLLVWRLEHGR